MTSKAYLEKLAKHNLAERPWQAIEAEAIFGRVICKVSRAKTWATERWRWAAVEILVYEREVDRHKLTQARARGYHPSFEGACAAAKAAADQINKEPDLDEVIKRHRARGRRAKGT